MLQKLPKIKIWRLTIIIAITITASLYLFKPIYLTDPIKFGFICKVCPSPSNDQLIAIRLAGENVTTLAKIIATPGEEVDIQAGKLTLNQRSATLALPTHFNYAPRKNEDFEFFVVIYDPNLSEIVDFGRIKQQRIIGKVVFLW